MEVEDKALVVIVSLSLSSVTMLHELFVVVIVALSMSWSTMLDERVMVTVIVSLSLSSAAMVVVPVYMTLPEVVLLLSQYASLSPSLVTLSSAHFSQALEDLEIRTLIQGLFTFQVPLRYSKQSAALCATTLISGPWTPTGPVESRKLQANKST